MKSNNVKRGFRFREKFVAASLLISIIAFVLLRYYLKDNKEYAWLVFLLPLVAPFVTGLKKITISYSFLVIIVYLILGFTCNWWHPGWVLFLTIPVFYIFFPKGIKSSVIRISDDDDDDDDETFTDL